MVPDNQRVVAIELGTRTYTGPVTTATTPYVTFTWGRDAGNTVRFTYRGQVSIKDRAYAARIYRHPERVLAAIEGNVFADLEEWFRRDFGVNVDK